MVEMAAGLVVFHYPSFWNFTSIALQKDVVLRQIPPNEDDLKLLLKIIIHITHGYNRPFKLCQEESKYNEQ